MPPAHRKGDIGSGPTTAISGDPVVNINGRPAMRVGDSYANGATLIEGSSEVFINGKPAGRIGDKMTSGAAATGSLDVFIGERAGESGGSGGPSDPFREDCDADPSS